MSQELIQQLSQALEMAKSEVETWKATVFANQEDLATVWRMNDDLKAEIALLKKKEQPTQEPVGRFVKATYGDYGVLAWHPNYVAKIGDCLYTHPAPTQPAQKPDLWKTQFLTDVMTSAGLLMHGRTDKKLAQRIADGSARWRTERYTHPAPTQPAQKPDLWKT